MARLGVLSDQPSGARSGVSRFTIAQLAASATDGWAGSRLGFVHLDVNGAEERVLRGAGAVIAQDRPVVTTEDESGPNGARLQKVRELLEGVGYRGRELPEVCGGDRRCRNYVWTHPAAHGGAIEEAVSELTAPKPHGPLRWCGVGDPGWADPLRRQTRYNRADPSHLGLRCGGE